MQNSDVSINKIDTYEQKTVSNSVKKVIDDLGGISKFVKKGDAVLLKPNLLAAKSPDKAVTTHPSVVLAVGEMVKDCGGKIIIGDSPAIGSWKTIAEKTGMAEVAKKLNAELIHFQNPVQTEKNEKHLFKQMKVSREVLDADVIINLPKLKTHVQMYLTLGVKNMFGCVVGKKKPQLHMEAGKNIQQFARMLVEIYGSISPGLTIMDGIIGMEGNGPGSGTPKPIGLMLASTDAVALDRTVCEIIGGDTEKLFILAAAKELGYGNTDLNNIKVTGESIENVKVDSFKFPVLSGAEFGPPFLRKLIKDLINTKPKEDRNGCTLCNFCIDVCPPKIIENIADKLRFNYDDCIRCYCCVEVCPEGAMKVKQGLLSKLLS